MDETESSFLLQKYRRDRRKLLEFVISSGLIPDTSSDSLDFPDSDLDTISADYVLDCVESGREFDSVEATRKYFEESDFPVTMNLLYGTSFFLLSNPELSGSPPQRVAPDIGLKVSSSHLTYSTKQAKHLSEKQIEKPGIGTTFEDFTATDVICQPVKDANSLSLGLPTLSTGLSDDDMRETAYEVLLASVILSGYKGPVISSGESKKDKKSKFLAGLRSKSIASSSRVQSEDSHQDILDVIRVQMEISEALHACTKKGLTRFYSKMTHDQTDVPQISLELLSSVCKSDFPNQRSYTQWLKRQARVLEELLRTFADFVADEDSAVSIISKLYNTEEWENMGPDGRVGILLRIKGYASRLASMPRKFGISNESYYWISSYHFNIKLYGKLLCSVFDVLEDDQIVEEAEEILKVLKLTWHALGITQKMHDALYSWLLFQQFVRTGGLALLKYAILQMQKVLSSKDDLRCEEAYLDNEAAYMSSLICVIEVYGSRQALNLVDAILFNMFEWCSSQLEDYHLYFGEENFVAFESFLILALLSGACFADAYEGVKGIKPMAGMETMSKLVRIFVERSIRAAYQRVLDFLASASKRDGKHPLAMLADELKLIAEKEFTSFIPVLCQRCPQAGIFSSILLHQLYRKPLKPFLESVSDLSESVRSVLAASDSLEHYLADILNSVCGEAIGPSISTNFHPYQIREISAPLILHWVNTQHDNLLEWTKRAIQIEDWEPLSSQQKQAVSIIEVFRIIEETVDQFFGLSLPMDIIHLRSLLIGIFRSLDAYLLHMVNQQVDKSILYPRFPTLTRYEESLNPFMKKKSAEGVVLEKEVANQLSNLTPSKLCVKLNTLKYIRDQLDILEDSIQQSWVPSRSVSHQILKAVSEDSSTSSESVDELFSIFDDIKRSAIGASSVIFDFIGTRVIFWDMRDSFLYSLYRGSVQSARLENLIPQLDGVLNSICDLIIDTLRDRVVLSICQASMDGYVWVMLNGGPSRVFSEADVTMMQDDLNILKDLFMANDQGLPSDEVEQESRLAQQIVDLYAMKADTIINMLVSASEQISYQHDPKKLRSRCARDSDTLLRVLCHKKDNDASKFLKVQYQLPKSSDYEDGVGMEPTTISPMLSDILNRNASFNWTEKGQRSFSMIKKKFQEVL